MFSQISLQSLATLLIVVVFILFMSFVVKNLAGGFIALMGIGLLVITFLAALSFMPSEIPEPFDLPQDEIKDCIDQGGFCGEFIYDVWDWEMPGG